jgi:ribosomal protein S18 acetylase RimI-like enzyme
MQNPPHPHLPLIHRSYTAADITALGRQERGETFYLQSLCYAQSLWQAGLPAQAILQCNRAFSVVLPPQAPVLRQHPWPYRALAWILMHRRPDQFLGNPTRHWQHLATRMVEPHKNLRTWRAWACWYIARRLLPEADFPADDKQLVTENLVEPTFTAIHHALQTHAGTEELSLWMDTLQGAGIQPPHPTDSASAAVIRPIASREAPVIAALAHSIWNAHYPGIISQAQIDYMLAIWYQPGAIAREIEEQGHCFALIEVADQPIGYLACEPQPAQQNLFISKLYLQPQYAGRGLGQQALRWLEELARQQGAHSLSLRVNKNNLKAIRAYLRAGFRIREAICTDIGSGYVMDDYLMEKAGLDRAGQDTASTHQA